MEQIKVSGIDLSVAVIIHPVTNRNEFNWDITIRPHQYERIAHVDIIALRKEYDKIGYTGEIKLVLRNPYDSDYPCSSFINNQEFFASLTKSERAEFLDKVNNSKIPSILRK